MTIESKIRHHCLKLKLLPTLCTVFVLVACEQQADVEQRELKEVGLSTDFVQRQVISNWQNLSRVDAGIPLQMYIRIGAATDPDVCTDGELYGPFTIEDGEVTGSGTVTASPPTRRLANIGDLTVCTIITSPVNAELDLELGVLYMDNDSCDQAPANIAGVWEGDYSCTSTCGDEAGFVSLTIDQDGYNATYSDGQADYEGTVCGARFEFSGGAPGYTEGGAFVLNQDGTASKTSSYESTIDSCSGTCSDPMLIRQ